MADQATVRRVVDRYFEYTGADVDRAEELYHDDAVLEFPQSGERFEGRPSFTEWRSMYPVSADDLRYRIVRVTARDDFAATELMVTYDNGETWVFAIQLLDFRGEKVTRERIYIADGWEAPAWRAKWRAATPPEHDRTREAR